jgi:hypothetical protein
LFIRKETAYFLALLFIYGAVANNMIFEGYIFHKDANKSRIIIEEQVFWFGFVFFIFCTVILDFNADFWNIDWIRITFKTLAISSLIIGASGKFLAMNKKEPIGGILKGNIKITPNLIEIEKSRYMIDEIENLKISINHFSGKLQNKRNNPGPWRSNGLGNKISFQSNGKKIKKTFFIQTEKDFEKLKLIKQEMKNTVGNKA